jgi:hypothetical protein
MRQLLVTDPSSWLVNLAVGLVNPSLSCSNKSLDYFSCNLPVLAYTLVF